MGLQMNGQNNGNGTSVAFENKHANSNDDYGLL